MRPGGRPDPAPLRVPGLATLLICAGALGAVALGLWGGGAWLEARSAQRRLQGPPNLFALPVVVDPPAGDPGPQAGTAFSISRRGYWLTARHVVADCSRIVLIEAPGLGAEAALVEADGAPAGGDLAVLRTEGGAPPLGLDSVIRLRRGEEGFHPGFPQGAPGEVATRLRDRQTLVRRLHPVGPGGEPTPMPVLTWTEVGRTRGLKGVLDGLSGAPVLDARGQVIGLTVAEAPRRHRLYALPPEALAPVYKAFASPPALPQPIGLKSYGPAAERLRQALSVVQVRCLPSR